AIPRRSWLRRSSVIRARFSPSTRTIPLSGFRRPTIWLTVTVLPAPEGPSNTVISPAGTLRSTPRKTSAAPKRLITPTSSIAGAGVASADMDRVYGRLPSCANAHRRAALHPAAGVLGRVLPPEDARRPRAPVRDGRGLEAA